MRFRLVATITVAISCFCFNVFGASEQRADDLSVQDADYLRDIKPIFAEKCAACHGPLKQESELRLDAAKLMASGGYSGPAIAPGNANDSLLLQRVTAAEDERMPPANEGEPLTSEQIALITEWINAGAKAPADEAVLEDPAQHWAYQPPRRAELPTTAEHPLDAFINARLQAEGLQAAPQADKRTLLRRVYFDVIGLPPTPEQLQASLADESPDAWANVIDELLESPHYGERWGRHWMDVWRYSDWDGYMQELRGSQRHIWRWRDWIVDSLNADKPYDRMVLEMLAGDELAPLDEEILPATGFLARNYHNSNRDIWLDATVEHTAKAFLGMTLNCARCHDHKFDPIPQQDYYTFRAIFEPHNVRTERLPGQRDLTQDGLPHAFDAEPDAATFLYMRGDEKQPDKEHPLSPQIPGVLPGKLQIEPVPLPLLAYYPVLRSETIAEDLQQAKTKAAEADQAFGKAKSSAEGDQARLDTLEVASRMASAELAALEARVAADQAKYQPEDANCDAEDAAELARIAATREAELAIVSAEAYLLEKRHALAAAQAKPEDEKGRQAAIETAEKLVAEAQEQLQEAQDKLESADAAYTPLGKEYPRQSTGRRLALARWITAKDNPLAARVAVNHIWLRHFGTPLVDNVFDLGLRSPQPEHAQLLDWLSVELVDSGWSMKHLHRLILTSAAWQRRSSPDETVFALNTAIDPDNNFLWRANVQRLDAEIVRDNVLAVAGSLDATFGGPEIDFTLGQESTRRSIYLRHAYEKQNRMLLLFDAPSPNECYRRSQSIIPQQALALANSALSLNQSRLLAGKLWQEISEQSFDCAEADNSAFIKAAFVRMLTRPPTQAERQACMQFLDDQAALYESGKELETFVGSSEAKVPPAPDPQARARESLIHVLMNHNDFLSIR